MQAPIPERQFHIVYVDGDHSYDGARSDFEYFGTRVVRGGWLVADDAGYFLPSTRFWKGYEVVSRAAQELKKLGFRNVLNIGHNCVFEKL
jgi:Methyltransferase domain